MNEHEVLLRLVDLVLVISVVELAWLMLRRQGVRLDKPSLLANLLAGLGLVLALRLGLSGAGLPWVALCLAGAGAAHAADLYARWQSAKA
jgi:hypothetical protein